MISDKAFLEFMRDDTLELSRERLERIIDDELEKPENEMDTGLIEYCLDALELNEKPAAVVSAAHTPAGAKRRVRKALIAAAAVIMLFTGLISFSAATDNALWNGLVEFYDNDIRIHFNKSDSNALKHKLLGTDLAMELAENGIAPVLLPAVMLTDEYEIVSIEYEETVAITSANIKFKWGDKKGNMIVEKYMQRDMLSNLDYVNADYFETIEVSGVEIYIFRQNRRTTITYLDGLTHYDIYTPLDFENAIEFAKTIK